MDQFRILKKKPMKYLFRFPVTIRHVLVVESGSDFIAEHID